jgi:hypothetical protein
VCEWDTVESESWFDSLRKLRKLECNTSKPGSLEFLKQREYDAEYPSTPPHFLEILEA